LSGLHKEYYENGNPWLEVNYRDDVAEGLVRQYYDNGSLQGEWHLKNAQRDGIARTFRRNNPETPLFIDQYRNGELTSHKGGIN
jgi:antitoxin component YwqK of YwqJK toxin-antitoxin module